MLTLGRAVDTPLPTLGLFAAAAFRLMPSINRILNAGQSLRFGLPVINTLHSELREFEVLPAPVRRPLEPFAETIELADVTYTYPNAIRPALHAVSLMIRRGDCVGFVGTSGAGKSTLVDILLGLLAPSGGSVRIDGEDVQKSMRNWQDQLGYVPQSIYLTDDTLARNVAFGLADAQIDTEAVWRALGAAQLAEFVRSLPDGLQTTVGERGIRLSGGQRQRIGIARALYHDPAVLVLDEATSSLDGATERGVMEAVSALTGSKTIIIVAHRLSTVAHCTKLFRLERGLITDQGDYAAVIGTASRLGSP
jgi:ATP-binding cassette, subfamily B, bacterial PglK